MFKQNLVYISTKIEIDVFNIRQVEKFKRKVE